MKKLYAALIIVLILMSAMIFNKSSFNKKVQTILTEAQARAIAEDTCIKGGGALAKGIYNGTTRTWWFDANLNATREGCSPACVVFEDNNSAEINWRCTGLVEPTGMVEVDCGDRSNYGGACAEIYEPVCGLIEVQCIKAPCEPIRQTFANSCVACTNTLTKSYYSGVCEETVNKEAVIKKLFSEKYPNYKDTLSINIGKEDNEHARGSVSFAPGEPGGIFLAAKVNGEWLLVYDGNGQIPCDLNEYGFSEDYLSDCSN